MRLLTAPQLGPEAGLVCHRRAGQFAEATRSSTPPLPRTEKARIRSCLAFRERPSSKSPTATLAEVMLSQPATKIFMKTAEPKAAEWISEAIGKVEIERLKETKV